MELSYIANNTFARVHQDPSKYLFIRGPVGSGKSSGCIWHILMNAFKQEPQYDGVRRSVYGVIRASYPALKSTVIKTWEYWFKNLINIVYDVPIRGRIIMDHPDGNTSIDIQLYFIALDREEDVNKLQSLELTGSHVNEAAEIPRGVHQMLKSRINRYPGPDEGGPNDSFIIADYNSVPTDHWLYKIAEEEKPPKHGFYSQPPALFKVKANEGHIVDAAGNTYVVNPDADNLYHWKDGTEDHKPVKTAIWSAKRQQWKVRNLDPDYYEDQVYGAEPDWVNVMILNNYGELRTGKPVYPEYIDDYHYNPKLLGPLKGVPLIIGMDLGLTPAAMFSQLTPTGKFSIFDEIVTDDCSIRKFCEDLLKPVLRTKYKDFNYDLVIDPAGGARSPNDAKSAMQIIKEAGLKCTLATTNDPLKRRESVVYFLRKVNGFEIGPNCPYLRKGFISEYKFEKKRLAVANVRGSNAEMFQEKPDKNIYSHVHDGCQYAALDASEGKSSKKKRPKRHSQFYEKPACDTSGY